MKLETGRILRSLLRKQPTFRDHWFPPETSGGRRGMSAVVMPCKFRARFFFYPLFSPLEIFIPTLFSNFFPTFFATFFLDFHPNFCPNF